MGVFPTRMLFATDGAEDALPAARAAVDLARRGGAELHVVSVAPERLTYGFMEEREQELFERGEVLALTEQERLIRGAGDVVAGMHLRMGRPAGEILGLAWELGVGLIAVGSRGLGPVGRLLAGSVSEGVAHRASCPILVVPGVGTWPPSRIVVGEDSSEEAREAGYLAASIGGLYGAQLTLVHVYRVAWGPRERLRNVVVPAVGEASQGRWKTLGERAGELEEASGRPPLVRAFAGDPATAILREAAEERAALVAVGSARLPGREERARPDSVSDKVMSKARGPVLIYPRHHRTGADPGSLSA
jgi:nucleotide-binding universal stress UspA family protein